MTDAVQFVADRVLPLLPEGQRLESLSLHPTCSSTQLGANDALTTIGAAVAHQVHVPVDWGCCGFAGDRGMLHPERPPPRPQPRPPRSELATTAPTPPATGPVSRDVPRDRPELPTPARAARGSHPTCVLTMLQLLV